VDRRPAPIRHGPSRDNRSAIPAYASVHSATAAIAIRADGKRNGQLRQPAVWVRAVARRMTPGNPIRALFPVPGHPHAGTDCAVPRQAVGPPASGSLM
jgi:hypothetical protein